MTLKVIEELWCDRCQRKFEKRSADGYSPCETLEIGWFKYRNGSGSKASPPGRSWENLDHDLCPICTAQFFDWWNIGSEADDDG